MNKPVIAVWFSCGAASAVALYLTIKKYSADHYIRAVNQPIYEEHHDNRRFARDVAAWCDIEIEEIRSSKFPSQCCQEVWAKRKFMSSPFGAPCTQELKKICRQEWEVKNKVDYHVFGFTADEKARHDRFTLTERSNVLPVLIEAEYSKQDCFDFIRKAGLKLPKMYYLGFPNANCIGCVKAASPTYWNHVRKHFPDIFRERAEQSREIGCKLVKVQGKRIYLDQLNPELIGRKMPSMPDCGLFCEEWEREEYQ